MKKILAASFLAISAGAACAADLPSAAPYQKAPMVDPGVNWSGFYIGVMGGYGWSDQLRATIGGVTATASSTDIKGGFGGGTLGYNWQTGSAVFGLETDAAWSDIKYSQTALGVTLTDRIQAFGSVTGRVGYAAGPALFYAKGGYAWMDNKLSATALGLTGSESHMHSGWTVGGGLEYMFVSNWSAKVEYMYADYRNTTYLAALGGLGLGLTVNTIKAGVNYHF